VADLIPAEAEGRCAARFGVFGEGGETFGAASDLSHEVGRHRLVLLVSDVDRAAVTAALVEPYAAVVEWGDDDETVGEWAAAPVPDAGFYVSLTTATAFGLQVAGLVSDTLTACGVVPVDQRSVIELCLQEAVANAIIHGNLGIASTAKDHPEGYRVFSQMVNERLGDRDLARRRLDVFVRWQGRVLDISVADQGAGFDAVTLPTRVEGNSRSGRGFVFMRALASRVGVSDGGRCTTLRFAL
jgi:anti-sigma regulatory factor (Ser/Thr protein kinase)